MCTPFSDQGFAISHADVLINTSDDMIEVLDVTAVEPRGVDIVEWRVHSEDEGTTPEPTTDNRLGEAAPDDTPHVPAQLQALLIVEFRSASPHRTAFVD